MQMQVQRRFSSNEIHSRKNLSTELEQQIFYFVEN